MALTGLFLVTFLIVHLSGNLILLSGDELAFNSYTRFMTTNPLIKASEIILLLGFLFHILYAFRLTNSNNTARPVKYAYKDNSANSSWFSRNMFLSGSIVFIFLIVHLVMFWGQYHYGNGSPQSIQHIAENNLKVTDIQNDNATKALEEAHVHKYLTEDQAKDLAATGVTELNAVSMYAVVEESFSQWWIVLFYVVAMILIAFHLNHGFQSAFRSMGWVHPKYMPIIRATGTLIAIAIPAGFAIIPILFLYMSATVVA